MTQALSEIRQAFVKRHDPCANGYQTTSERGGRRSHLQHAILSLCKYCNHSVRKGEVAGTVTCQITSENSGSVALHSQTLIEENRGAWTPNKSTSEFALEQQSLTVDAATWTS